MAPFKDKISHFCLLIAISILSYLLCGCGGGGVSSPLSDDIRAMEPAGERSVNLHNYNNWSYTTDKQKDDPLALQILARRNRICIPEAWLYKGITPAVIKSVNPSAKVYVVHDLCVKNSWDTDWENSSDLRYLSNPLTKSVIDSNNWWLRDANGNIVKESERTWFLDVGKTGFKEAFLENLLHRLDGKGFDGVVFDYWWPNASWIADNFSGELPFQGYANDEEWFEKAWKPFIQYVMNGLHSAGYRIIGNCAGESNLLNPKQQFQRTLVDGIVYEQFIFNWASNEYISGDWVPASTVERRINALQSDPLEVWVEEHGLKETDLYLARKQEVSLAAYYIGVPSSQQNRFYNNALSYIISWSSLWDFSIGTPAEPPTKQPDRYFWSRKYTNGIVLLNYEENESIKYSLDGIYRDPNGKIMSGEVTLSPRTALILAKNIK